MKRRRRRNPTLVHHGRAKAAAFHVLSADGRRAIADLYGVSVAKAKRLAARFGERVMLLDNRGQPRVLVAHRQVAVSRSNPPRRKAAALDPRSLRTVRSGRARVVVGCPKGHYHPRRKGRRKCDRGTRARSVRVPKRARRNPGPPVGELARGGKLFQTFHGFGPARVRRGRVRGVPPVMVKIGEVVRLDYLSDKWDRKRRRYMHETAAPHPVLYTGTDGSHHLVGGRMSVTERGLEH